MKNFITSLKGKKFVINLKHSKDTPTVLENEEVKFLDDNVVIIPAKNIAINVDEIAFIKFNGKEY